MRRSIGVLAALGLALTTACTSNGGGGATSAKAARLDVVAGFYPLAEAARRIGGGAVDVVDLTPAGVEPHDLELSTRDVDRIEDADVVVYLGRGFQPAVEKVAERSRGIGVDVVANGVEARTDPHVWLDPTKMAEIVERTASALDRAAPSHRNDFEANAAEFVQELRDLDEAFVGGLRDCDRREIVTAHAAFGHLAAKYGLVQAAITGIEPTAEPDPKRLAELASKVRTDGVTTVFTESLVSPKVAATLAREAGIGTAVLDPLEGLATSRIEAGEGYVSVMRDNLAALRLALGCR